MPVRRNPGRGSDSPRRSGSQRPGSGAGAYLAIPAFLAICLVVNAIWPLSAWVAGFYLAASVCCFVAYAVDKSAASAGRWRVPESTLLIWGAVGGWPGAIVAQQTLRHKTRKAGFRSAFWGSVVLNVMAFVGLSAVLLSGVMAG
ncbi:DUF1294 domain-containing protein [Cryobacterium algoritolerans]|uniref:DUF1294 domain-containing protein n=1 Tax=Cryobacterium algoritolerans TaxID=1259184 RepID=A0A4R8WZD1_9MICO|nr:DUF1294 domain-containing protein [Cryobacterium algoritolerans]TFC19592.1 DUF1294 domain-containing protein [Cryobacterium algoritolerans]